MTADECAVLKTPAQVAELLKKSRATVYGWMHAGVLANGRRVRLEAVRIGGHSYIRPAALDEFMRACSPPPPARAPESPARRAARFRADKARALAILRGEA